MSASTLYRIYPTHVHAIHTYRNASGAAYRLWDALATRYLGQAPGLATVHAWHPLWDLARTEAVPVAWRRTLEWTFDYWICPPVLLPALIEACLEVGMALQAEEPRLVNHWPAFAYHLETERLRTEPELLGYGLGCTSVRDLWVAWRADQHPYTLMARWPEEAAR